MKALLLLGCMFVSVKGHARLLEPPSRASMWRSGFDNPPDYQDNESFCGGFRVCIKQHANLKLKCILLIF